MTTSDTHAETEVDPGKALIYLIEEQKLRVFRDVTVRVGLDGKWVGAIRGTSYLSFAVEPGEHHLCVDFPSEFLEPGRLVSLYGFTAQAGKTYYFRARTGNRDIAVLDLDFGERRSSQAACSEFTLEHLTSHAMSFSSPIS